MKKCTHHSRKRKRRFKNLHRKTTTHKTMFRLMWKTSFANGKHRPRLLKPWDLHPITIPMKSPKIHGNCQLQSRQRVLSFSQPHLHLFKRSQSWNGHIHERDVWEPWLIRDDEDDLSASSKRSCAYVHECHRDFLRPICRPHFPSTT